MAKRFCTLNRPDSWLIVATLISLSMVGWSTIGWTEEEWKQAAFDCGLAMLVSVFIYLLISWWPEQKKKIALRAYLNSHYIELQNELIYQYLRACGESADADVVQELEGQQKFRTYFIEKISTSQDRWHAVANGLSSSEDRLLAVLAALKRFQTELDVCVTLSAVNIEQGGFMQLRHLSQNLKRTREQAVMHDYDGIKQLCRFLWSLHTGWSFVDGYSNKDFFHESIHKGF